MVCEGQYIETCSSAAVNKRFWRSIILIVTPLLLVAVPLYYEGKAGKCAYVVLLMAIYYMTEPIPQPATSLLPIALYPLLGVMKSKDVCQHYLKDANFLIASGFLFAVAIEKWDLHKRIAFKVLLTVGCQPSRLIIGFMITSAFLSMWLSNTATTAMLIPFAQAVIMEIDKDRKTTYSTEVRENPKANINVNDEDAVELNSIKGTCRNSSEEIIRLCTACPEHIKESPDMSDKDFHNFTSGIKICIAVASSIGGAATLTGSGPNIIMKGVSDSIYGQDTGLNYGTWFMLGFPTVLVCLFLSSLWLVIFFVGPRELCKKNKKYYGTLNMIQREYNKLGVIKFSEVMILLLFTVLVLLWLTKQVWRKLNFIQEGYVSDASVGVTIAVLLFMIPSIKPNMFCCKKDAADVRPVPAILVWNTVHEKLPWGVLILLGGNFAMADGCLKSGLATDIGSLFMNISKMQPWVLAVLLSCITAAITEILTNNTTVIILMPIIAKLAESKGIHPHYLMLAVAISCSFSFMFPIATAPNLIAYHHGGVKMMDMVKCGALLNIICIIVLQLTLNTVGSYVFSFDTYPMWAGTEEIMSTQSSVNITT